MEKIIVFKSNNRDDNLVECLKMLFPECAIEVREKRPHGGNGNRVPSYSCTKVQDKRLN